MMFKNAMSFKAKIKQVADSKGISAQQPRKNNLIEEVNKYECRC